MANKKRIEFDSLGSKKIDQNKLWGAQTQRSLENFTIGSEKMPSELIVALGQQKKEAAEANIELGVIDKKLGLYETSIGQTVPEDASHTFQTKPESVTKPSSKISV